MTNNRNPINKTMTIENIITEDHNYYNYTTQPGVSQEKPYCLEDFDLIKEAYHDNISDTITATVANMIEKAFYNGLTRDEIIMAIEDTGMARYPSPWYLKKILETWAENGVTVSRLRNTVKANKANVWWK